MSALSLLVLCAVFVLLVLLYLALIQINSWRLSDASRRASITRWLQQNGQGQSPPSSKRITELLNNHLQNSVRSKRTAIIDELAVEHIAMEEVSTGAVDHLYHVISVSNDDNDNNKLVAQVGVSLYNTNTEWIITTTKYGIVSCNVFFHCYETRVTVEFNKVEDNLILFGVHQLEPVNIQLSVTVTSPAMKDPVSVGNQVTMVIQDYLSCVNWSNETLVARATPNRWESFTPKQLVSKETFFADDSSPADVSMDTAISNVEPKETSVIQDATWVAMGTPSPTDSSAKEISASVVKEDESFVTKDTPTTFNQSQSADKKPDPLPLFLLSSHDPPSVNTSLAAPVNDGDSDRHSNTDQHPMSIKLKDVLHDTVTMETPASDGVGHAGSYSVPVTPMKPYQSSSANSDYHQRPSMFPRRSHSYEHLEEVSLTPLASSLPPHQSGSQSGSAGFRFRGNVLASIGSSSDVLEDMSDANNTSEVASYVSANSTSSTSQPTLLVFEFQESGITRHIAVDTTLDKVPRFRNATKLHIWNDHVFVASHLKSTVACEVCNKKIHRILGKRNVYVCRDCKMCTHKHCHGSVKDACPNSSYPHMTINYAESNIPK